MSLDEFDFLRRYSIKRHFSNGMCIIIIRIVFIPIKQIEHAQEVQKIIMPRL